MKQQHTELKNIFARSTSDRVLVSRTHKGQNQNKIKQTPKHQIINLIKKAELNRNPKEQTEMANKYFLKNVQNH